MKSYKINVQMVLSIVINKGFDKKVDHMCGEIINYPPSNSLPLFSHTHSHTHTHTHTHTQATGPQPGLKLLLDGEVAASPSLLSLTHDPILIPPPSPGSVRSCHSTLRSSRHAPSSVKTIDDVVRGNSCN